MSVLALLCLPMIFVELMQLLMAERFIGVKQIKDGRHPLDVRPVGPPFVAALWISLMLFSWTFILVLLSAPSTRMQAFIMLFISLAAIPLRRGFGLKWALVIMTVVGAVRMGLYANIFISIIFMDGGQGSGYWSY